MVGDLVEEAEEGDLVGAEARVDRADVLDGDGGGGQRRQHHPLPEAAASSEPPGFVPSHLATGAGSGGSRISPRLGINSNRPEQELTEMILL